MSVSGEEKPPGVPQIVISVNLQNLPGIDTISGGKLLIGIDVLQGIKRGGKFPPGIVSASISVIQSIVAKLI